MPGLPSLILRLYPRPWRRRYGAEMQEVLSRERLTVRVLADVVAGAIDARMNPDNTPPAPSGMDRQGGDMVKVFRGNPAEPTAADRWRSAGWLVGGSLVLTAIAILLQMRVGRNALSEGLLYSAFPASLMLSGECTYLKRYSRAARTTIAVGGALAVVLLTWAAVAVGHRI